MQIRRVLVLTSFSLFSILILAALVFGRHVTNDAMVVSKLNSNEVRTPPATTSTASDGAVVKIPTPSDRKRAAERLEEKARGEGLDVRVNTLGSDATTLQVRYAKLSKPLIYAVMSNDQLTRKLKGVGFAEVKFDSGSETWVKHIE